jgi:hypothetical protein
MEVGASLKKPEAQETWPQPDLLEVYRNRVVTVLGITGTLEELATMCPVDLNNSSITQDAKNKFVVKAANEAGLEISPEHEDIFSRVVEESGLERNFSVARAEEAVRLDPILSNIGDSFAKITDGQESTKEPHSRIADKELFSPPDTAQKDLLPPETVMSEILVTMTDESASRHISDPQEPNLPVPKVKNTTTAMTVAQPGINVKSHDVTPRIAATDIQELQVPKTHIQQINAQSPNADANQTLQVVDLDTEQPFEVSNNYLHEQPVGTTQEIYPNMASVWEAELAKDDLEVYEDFKEALFGYIELAQPHTVGTESAGHNLENEESLPPIITKVAERLELLEADDKEQVAPLLKNIVGVVHGLQLLEEREASPELTEEVHNQLEELCVELFEALGIDYNEEDINQFIAVIISPDFKASVKAEPRFNLADLTTEGAHEAKQQQMCLGDDQVVHNRLQCILGMFVLLNTWLRSEVGSTPTA